MSTVAFFEKFFINSSVFIRKLLVTYGEYENVYRKRKQWGSITFSYEQKKEIRNYYKANYGKRIPLFWHRLYQSYTGTYRYDYFPEILFSAKLEPKWNPYREAEFLDDKNLLPILFGRGIENIHIPNTYISCIGGIFKDGNERILCKEAAVKVLHNVGECIMKRTVNTSSGRDVFVCNIKNGIDIITNQSVESIVNQLGDDFVIQERIKQNPVLQTFNNSSVNTFRIITYILNGSVYVCPAALRLGRNGADKDNMHFGGICVGINPDGFLKKYAFSEYGERFEMHPDSGIKFEGCKIDLFPLILNTAKLLHQRIPFCRIISWDLSLDENGKVVLIEMNTTGQSAWFCQMVNGESLFGDNTSAILRLLNNAKQR